MEIFIPLTKYNTCLWREEGNGDYLGAYFSDLLNLLLRCSPRLNEWGTQ